MKIQESPDDIKDMFILRYIMHKFEIDFSYVPFISGNKNLLLRQIHEAFSYSHKDLKKRYEVDIKNSGTTLCSAFILGNILYIVNVGDSRAVLGTYFSKVNIWKTTQLSVDHKPKSPKESKRILLYHGRIDRLKNEYGEEYGPYRVFEKENDSVYPGLAISRTIGDDDAKKLGVVFEPDLFKYELKENDKVIIIGTDGLWDILSNEEAIQIVGECKDNNKKCQEAAKILVDYATKKVYKKYNIKMRESESKSDTEENKNNKSHSHKSKKHFISDDIEKIIDDMTCIVIYLDIKK
jgi:integrin-linked kinase-associated serine/threonine phosphatase 2C